MMITSSAFCVYADWPMWKSGADGRIEKAYYGVKATGHVDRLRKELGV